MTVNTIKAFLYGNDFLLQEYSIQSGILSFIQKECRIYIRLCPSFCMNLTAHIEFIKNAAFDNFLINICSFQLFEEGLFLEKNFENFKLYVIEILKEQKLNETIH